LKIENIVRIEITNEEAANVQRELNGFDLSDEPTLGKLFDEIAEKTGLSGE
jgi:hypothetical protein